MCVLVRVATAHVSVEDSVYDLSCHLDKYTIIHYETIGSHSLHANRPILCEIPTFSRFFFYSVHVG